MGYMSWLNKVRDVSAHFLCCCRLHGAGQPTLSSDHLPKWSSFSYQRGPLPHWYFTFHVQTHTFTYRVPYTLHANPLFACFFSLLAPVAMARVETWVTCHNTIRLWRRVSRKPFNDVSRIRVDRWEGNNGACGEVGKNYRRVVIISIIKQPSIFLISLIITQFGKSYIPT